MYCSSVKRSKEAESYSDIEPPDVPRPLPKMTKAQRSKIAAKAAKARWKQAKRTI